MHDDDGNVRLHKVEYVFYWFLLVTEFETEMKLETRSLERSRGIEHWKVDS